MKTEQQTGRLEEMLHTLPQDEPCKDIIGRVLCRIEKCETRKARMCSIRFYAIIILVVVLIVGLVVFPL